MIETDLRRLPPAQGVEFLYRVHGAALFRHLTLLVGTDAEDLTQEVFLKLARKYDAVAKSKSPKSYLFQMARNLAFDFLKRRRLEFVEIQMEPAASLEITFASQQEEQRLIADALGRLPAEQREAIGLHYFENLSLSEVADNLGISINTVASRIRYGLEKLQKLIPLPYET